MASSSGTPSVADQAIAADLLSYLNASVTEWHAVEEARQRLLAAGFQQLSERQTWEGVAPGGRYFFTRNASTLVAFAVGQKYEPGNGFMMVGAHTDRWVLSQARGVGVVGQRRGSRPGGATDRRQRRHQTTLLPDIPTCPALPGPAPPPPHAAPASSSSPSARA
jgi:hypothetical protein